MSTALKLLSLFSFVASALPSRVYLQTAQLSTDVIPTNYVLDLTLEADFFASKTFTGIATISISVQNATRSFQFHSKNLEFTDTSFTVGGSSLAVSFSSADPDTDLVTLTSEEDLIPGDYVLTVNYAGILNEDVLAGFYLSSYVDAFKQERHLAATQFEDIGARRAFPCFDEPGFKAPFDVYITRPKQYHVFSNKIALSNTAVGEDKERSHFSKTKPIPTYLVAFLVTDFNCKNANKSGTAVVQLCSKISAFDDSAKLALDVAPHIVDRMGDFTTVKYSTINSNLLTLAAIPDFAAGAMENLGLITFKESYLLWDEAQDSVVDKQHVVRVLAHEIAHQWFGDYVTLQWWSDLFLNEGFASYFEYYITHLEQPEWKIDKQFVLEELQPALLSDSFDDVLPLSFDATNPDFQSRTNDVSYTKGSSVLRLLQNFLTPENFQLGLQDYLKDNQFGSVTPDLLWTSLQVYADNLGTPLPADLSVIMENWIKKPNYPILSVKREGRQVVISQEACNGDATEWYVPITYGSLSGNESLTTSWLTPGATWTVPTDNLIVLYNGQFGYYRVDYSDDLWQNISSVLNSEDIGNTDEISRAQFIDDRLSLVRFKDKDLKEALNFLSFLKRDSSYFVWYTAFKHFEFLLQRTSDFNVRDSIAAFLKEHMQTLLQSVPISEEKPEDHVYALTQILAQTWACKLDEEDCVNFSTERFSQYIKNASTKLSPNLKSVILCTGLKYSNSSMEDVRTLLERLKESKSATGRLTLLNALGCANNSQERLDYLSWTSGDLVKMQEVNTVFASVYSNSPEGVTDALNFVVDQHRTIVSKFGGSTSNLRTLIRTLGGLLNTQKQIDRLVLFNSTEDLNEEIRAAVTDSVNTASQNLKLTSRVETVFTKATPNSATQTLYSLYLYVLVGIIYRFW